MSFLDSKHSCPFKVSEGNGQRQRLLGFIQKLKLQADSLPSELPASLDDRESVCNAGDPDSIPGLGRSPGERNDKILQYSCLENSVDRGAWQAAVHGVTKSRTRLTNTHRCCGSRYSCTMKKET